MDFNKDYYSILEVHQNATETEIRLSYRRLAKLYHPDRNPGNLEFEEKTKLINEAKDILLDTNNRFIYDQYLKSVQDDLEKLKAGGESKAKRQKETNTENSESAPIAQKKKTYTRTRTVETVIRHYFKGIIFIKYFAPFDIARNDLNLRESFYQMHFTDVYMELEEKDIEISDAPPKNLASVFNNYPPTNIPILQPIKTIIKGKEKEGNAYLFYTEDIRITDPKITLVTKHESTSFGTIESPIYGCIMESKYHDITETVEESSGPTGRKETKVEEGIVYSRAEYYYYNGETYWGNWIRETPDYQQGGFKNNSGTWNTSSSNHQFNRYAPSGGCAPTSLSAILGIIYLSLLLFSIPRLLPIIVFLLFIFLIVRVINLTAGTHLRITPWLSVIFIVLFFAGLFSRCSQSRRPYWATRTNVESPRERDQPVVQPIPQHNNSKQDSLIIHFRSWADYDNNIYSGTYTIRTSDLLSATSFKNGIEYPVNNNNSYDHLVYDLKNHDSSCLSSLFNMFDTTRANRGLTNNKFAEMIVSFVQDIPYSLVLDKSCDPTQYSNPFIRNYLTGPNAICEPYQRFGINTPVEFMATLKGDCDTRTLFLYQVLAHYNYDVIMLSSTMYNHSLIGINLPYSGTSFIYEDRTYVLWETTSPGFPPGLIPHEISNLDYWRISLKSK